MTDIKKIDMLKDTIEFLYTKESRGTKYIAKLLQIKEINLKQKLTDWNFIKGNEKHILPSNLKHLNSNKNKIINMLDSDFCISDIAKEINISSKILYRYINGDAEVKNAKEKMDIRKKNNHNLKIENLKEKSSRNYNVVDLDNEMWKEITGFDNYFVSNMGRIKKLTKRYNSYYLLTLSENSKNGRLYVSLHTNDKVKNYQVSRLVGHCFVDGFSTENNIINHIDGDVKNNKATNLEWVPQSVNNKKAYADLHRNISVHYSKYGKFKKIILNDKYEFKTLEALSKFIGKSPTQIRRYIDNECKSDYKIQFIY